MPSESMRAALRRARRVVAPSVIVIAVHSPSCSEVVLEVAVERHRVASTSRSSASRSRRAARCPRDSRSRARAAAPSRSACSRRRPARCRVIAASVGLVLPSVVMRTNELAHLAHRLDLALLPQRRHALRGRLGVDPALRGAHRRRDERRPATATASEDIAERLASGSPIRPATDDGFVVETEGRARARIERRQDEVEHFGVRDESHRGAVLEQLGGFRFGARTGSLRQTPQHHARRRASARSW